MLSNELKKWTKTISMALSRTMTYKLDFFLTLTLPPLVFVLVSYAIWAQIFDRHHLQSVGGFTRDEMLRYQCWTFIATLLARSHRSWNLSEDIRFGRITAFLLYPFSVWSAYTAEFIAFQVVQLFIVALTLSVMIGSGLVPAVSIDTLLAGVCVCLAVGFLWFTFEFVFGSIAFWIDESWILRLVFFFLTTTLSGGFIPIELFPQWLQVALQYTPFPLLTSIPVHIFLGTQRDTLLSILAQVIVWISVMALCAQCVWHRGLRQYTAAGM